MGRNTAAAAFGLKYIVLCTVGLAFGGCSNSKTLNLSVAEEALMNYQEGMEDLADGDYTEAINSFRKVAKAPRYVRWSALAKLRIADSLFFSGKYAEAAQEYESFILQYQGDPNEAHAQFGLSKSYVEQIPSDMWILPPSYEREREALNRSRRELEVFIGRFVQDRRFVEASVMLEDVKDMQFSFLNYVAAYYEDREEPGGVIVRCEHALSVFPERAAQARMDLRLAKAYLAKDHISDALRVYRDHLDSGVSAGDEVEQEVKVWVQKLEGILASKKGKSPSAKPQGEQDKSIPEEK